MSAALALLALVGTPPVAEDPAVAAARAFRTAHGGRILRQYAELLRLPNVAADLDDVRRVAAELVRLFEARGASMEAVELEGAPPLVLGALPAPGATRTLGIYVHYDGQPVVPEEWTNPPWEPVLYDGAIAAGGERLAFPADDEPLGDEWRLYARSASDDKAPFPALLTALDALAQAEIARTSNLVFLFEGEEEAGSPHLEAYLERHAERLREVDLWLILDGPMHTSRRPQLVFGVRGVVGLELTVYGAARPLHSGHYGNWAPNPAHELALLLASMKDADGRVLVEGFYDDVAPLGEAERAALAALPAVDADLREELALGRTEGGAPLAERILLPSLNVRGLAGGAVGARARNVIPSEATASLDVRLVKGCDAARMLARVEAHVRGQGWHVVREAPGAELRRRHPRLARIVRGPGYGAVRTPMDLPLVPVLAAAVERAAGEPPVRVPSLGGSLPLASFERVLAQPLVICPIANHDNSQHAPDENLRLANLGYGIDLMAALLTMPAD